METALQLVPFQKTHTMIAPTGPRDLASSHWYVSHDQNSYYHI